MAVKYLVSGGEGALGKTVISMLLQRGEKVRILMSELSDTRIYRNNPNIEICYGISTDKDSMIEFFDLEDPRSAILFHTDEYVSLSDVISDGISLLDPERPVNTYSFINEVCNIHSYVSSLSAK